MSKILIFLEPEKDALKRASYEVISAAKVLAEQTSSEMIGLVLNSNEDAAKNAGKYGLENIINVKSDALASYSSEAASQAVWQIAKEENTDIILFSANATGKELAPRVAGLMDAGYVSDCVSLESNNGLTAKKPVYAGKAQIEVKPTTENKVFSLRPNVFTAKENPGDIDCIILIKNNTRFTPEIIDKLVNTKKLYNIHLFIREERNIKEFKKLLDLFSKDRELKPKGVIEVML
jgi:electron transfer flavoprotein alpha subunit